MENYNLPPDIQAHLHTYDGGASDSVCNEIRMKLHDKIGVFPKVSIVIIAYNEEKHLLRSISSLAHQRTTLPYEIIVVDNNSKDKTLEIAKKCGVIAIKEERQGVGFARQAGMDRAYGEIHLCADADTVYPPYYIETMVNELEQKNIAAVFGLVQFLPQDGKTRLQLSIYEWFKNIAIKMRAKKRPELCCGGASFGFRTEHGRSFGWRTDIARGEDGSMAHSLKKYGRVKLVVNKKARIWTSARTLVADGSFTQLIWKRIVRELRRLPEYFTRKRGEYKTQSYNVNKTA